MFMNDTYVGLHETDWSMELPSTSLQMTEAHHESDSYQALLNTVDAARNGLAWGENDYDIAETETA